MQKEIIQQPYWQIRKVEPSLPSKCSQDVS